MRMYHHRCNCHSFSCKSRFRRSDTLERRFHDGSNVVLVARVLLLHPPSHAKQIGEEMPHDPRRCVTRCSQREANERPFSSGLSVGPRPCLFIKCTAYLHARTWPRVMYRDSRPCRPCRQRWKTEARLSIRRLVISNHPARLTFRTRTGFNQMDERRQPIFARIDRDQSDWTAYEKS